MVASNPYGLDGNIWEIYEEIKENRGIDFFVWELQHKFDEGQDLSDEHKKRLEDEYDVAISYTYDFNYIHWYHKSGLPKSQNLIEKERLMYADVINDYPPHVQDTLDLFVKTFRFPPSAIPKKPKRKNSKSEYALWINQIEEMNEIAGKHIVQAMQMSFGKYKSSNRNIRRPMTIKDFFIDSVSQCLREEDDNVPDVVVPQDSTTMSIEDVKDIGDIFD